MRKRMKPGDRPSIGDFLPLLQSNSLGYFYGLEPSGEPLAGTLQVDTPLLILGAVGAGKTLLLASILRQLYAANSLKRLLVTIIDPDRGLAPFFESREQTGMVAERERDFMDALAYPFEESDLPGSPYQLLLVDEMMYLRYLPERLAPYGPLQEPWLRFQEILTQLADDEDLRQRVGVIVTSTTGSEEVNALFPTTIYIPQGSPFAFEQQLAAEPRLVDLVSIYGPDHFFIKRREQDYLPFRAPFFSVSGPPSVPDLLWDRDR